MIEVKYKDLIDLIQLIQMWQKDGRMQNSTGPEALTAASNLIFCKLIEKGMSVTEIREACDGNE